MNIYKNEHIDFLSLFNDMHKRWGEEFLFFEPETIVQLLERQGYKIHPRVKEKIEAVKALVRNNLCYEQWHLFEKMVLVINNLTPNFNIIQVPQMREICKGVKVMLQIKEEKFSDEVSKYIAAAGREQGFIYLPKPIEFANKYLYMLYHSLEDYSLCDAVKEGWKIIQSEDPTTLKFDEDKPVDMQLAKLLELKLYCDLNMEGKDVNKSAR